MQVHCPQRNEIAYKAFAIFLFDLDKGYDIQDE
jgi:hypothetical protein